MFQNNKDPFAKKQIYFKGGDSGDSFDAAYNERMATIAEQQQGMAMEYFDFWKSDYKTLEQAQIQSNLDEVPFQSALNLENIQAQRDALPGQVALGQAQNEYGIEEINANSSLLPGQTGLTLEQIAAQRDLLPGQTAYTSEQIAAGRQLLPGQTALTSEQIAAQRRLLPGQTNLSELQMSDTTAGIQERAPVRSAFYKSALDGINVDQRVSDASADVMHSFKGADAINRRNIARTGVNPNSGRYEDLSRRGSLDMAKSVAGAKTQARTLAELEKFGRLQGAMGVA
jgi:hypothetical protein